ncbi:ott like deaminase protein [Rutstroemia sp. NJR-2017a BBW]|nr:ott like deaminase protein [Rutstroemia sp. NJR-2017a BBW]
MSASSDFWNPANTHCFHQQIVKLHAWNGVPTGPADYRCEKREESSCYILSTAEEIHLADHIAFLAQRKSGAKYVSAATIEEHHGMKGDETEMRIRISANETPKLDVVTGLTGVMQRVEMYAAEGKSRDDFCEDMFDKVISFSSQRLNERLRSRKHNGHQVPLHLRINSLLEQMKTTVGWRDDEAIASLIYELEDLACCYEKVVDTGDPEVQHEIFKAAVRKSFLIPFQRKSRSLEEYLKSVGANQMVYQNREVMQIDKIARYLGLCKDFLRICRQPRHRRLFKRIQIEHCVAPPITQPTGAIKHCHVHGEVQLVLHYEQFPHDPQPRAIGSSKSACFLCDLFIGKHGQYRVSHSHNHLYPQWTVPNSMIHDMARLRETPIQRKASGVGDCESKAHLPGWQFSTDTASTISRSCDSHGDFNLYRAGIISVNNQRS